MVSSILIGAVAVALISSFLFGFTRHKLAGIGMLLGFGVAAAAIFGGF
jgi:hypothetical protein